jgi:hypothetical protein
LRFVFDTEVPQAKSGAQAGAWQQPGHRLAERDDRIFVSDWEQLAIPPQRRRAMGEHLASERATDRLQIVANPQRPPSVHRLRHGRIEPRAVDGALKVGGE